VAASLHQGFDSSLKEMPSQNLLVQSCCTPELLPHAPIVHLVMLLASIPMGSAWAMNPGRTREANCLLHQQPLSVLSKGSHISGRYTVGFTCQGVCLMPPSMMTSYIRVRTGRNSLQCPRESRR